VRSPPARRACRGLGATRQREPSGLGERRTLLAHCGNAPAASDITATHHREVIGAGGDGQAEVLLRTQLFANDGRVPRSNAAAVLSPRGAEAFGEDCAILALVAAGLPP